jgi:outer membrane protein OmpA-like peptidoglycan-associated protein
MDRIKKLRLAAALCLLGGVLDAGALAGWAWPRALAPSPATMIARIQPRAAAISTVVPGAATARPAAAPLMIAAAAARPTTAPNPQPPPTAAILRAPAAAAPPAIEGESPPPADAQEPAGASTAAVGVLFFGTRAVSHWVDGDQQLQQLAERARRDAELVVEVDGHSDRVGDRRANAKLSLHRAQAVAAALRAAGIPPERLMVHGYGASRPRARGDSPAALRLNRRVEIHLASKGSP